MIGCKNHTDQKRTTMANLNLAEAEYQQNKSSISYTGGLVVIFVILVMLLGGYLWIYFSEKSVDSSAASAKSQYDEQYAKLTGTGNKDVVDFQNRILTAKGLTDQEKAGYQSLPATEQSMVPGTYLESFSYDQSKKTVTVIGVADNYNILAKQILSFKKSDYFSDISTGATSLDKNGKVDFSLSMTTK